MRSRQNRFHDLSVQGHHGGRAGIVLRGQKDRRAFAETVLDDNGDMRLGGRLKTVGKDAARRTAAQRHADVIGKARGVIRVAPQIARAGIAKIFHKTVFSEFYAAVDAQRFARLAAEQFAPIAAANISRSAAADGIFIQMRRASKQYAAAAHVFRQLCV